MSEATKRIPPVFTPETPPGTETKNRTTVSLATTVQSGDEVFTRKTLGQSKPGAATLTALYTVPSNTAAEVVSLYIANQSSTATSFRIAVSPLGAAIAVAQYLFFDVPIAGLQTVVIEEAGILLAATDILRVYATLATVSFSAFGTEFTARV